MCASAHPPCPPWCTPGTRPPPHLEHVPVWLHQRPHVDRVERARRDVGRGAGDVAGVEVVRHARDRGVGKPEGRGGCGHEGTIGGAAGGEGSGRRGGVGGGNARSTSDLTLPSTPNPTPRPTYSPPMPPRAAPPVHVLCAVAHAVDAVVFGEVRRDRVLQRRLELARRRGAAAQHAANLGGARGGVKGLSAGWAAAAPRRGARLGLATSERCPLFPPRPRYPSPPPPRPSYPSTLAAAPHQAHARLAVNLDAVDAAACQVGMHRVVQRVRALRDAHAFGGGRGGGVGGGGF
jgi:hypothetical protein